MFHDFAFSQILQGYPDECGDHVGLQYESVKSQFQYLISYMDRGKHIPAVGGSVSPRDAKCGLRMRHESQAALVSTLQQKLLFTQML